MLADIIAGVFFLLAMLCVFAAVRDPHAQGQAMDGSLVWLAGAALFGALTLGTLLVKLLVWAL